jgi:adenylosuccinate synthase
MYADVVLGLQHGDEAKGKVTHYLSRYKDYTHVLRFNGGCNAGHTIYHNGKKFVTHHIPAGVFFGVKSIIGSGCVVNVTQFFKELRELEEGGLDVEGKIFIAENAHVITEEHIQEENKETKIGTTKRGNGPAYRDKYNRTGILAKQVPVLEKYLINLYEEFHEDDRDIKILCEGAQGFGLDVDWGDYPYVTSSHCTVAGALLNAIPPSWIRDVWGVAKIYETYVGAKQFEPHESEFFARIREVGDEYGATTGRPRQCNWLNFNELEKAIKINGVNRLVINKMDVLREIDAWTLIRDGHETAFASEEDIKFWLETNLNVEEIYFSDNKHRL